MSLARFADLIDRLIYTRSRNAKLDAIATFLRNTPDPDRGWALAALTDALDFPAVKAGTVRGLAHTRIDEDLFRLSRQFVGDSAETVALLWEGREVAEIHSSPSGEGNLPAAAPLGILPTPTAPLKGRGLAFADLSLDTVVETLSNVSRSNAPAQLAALLDAMDANERYAALKKRRC